MTFNLRNDYVDPCRLHMLELGVGIFLFICGYFDFAFGEYRYYIYLYLQAIAFFIMGFGYIGIEVPNT